MDVPELIAPMLAAGGPVPAGPGWAYEFKYDGVRALCYLDGGDLRVLSRNNNLITGTYPELASLGSSGRRAVLDGEIVALEPGERPSFSRLQQRMHVAAPAASLIAGVPVVYYVFDVLHLDGRATWELPWSQRRELLEGLDLAAGSVRVPPVFADGADGPAALGAALYDGGADEFEQAARRAATDGGGADGSGQAALGAATDDGGGADGFGQAALRAASGGGGGPEGFGQAVLRAAELAGTEGVVAKRRDAPYRPGKRSADWTKTPLIRTQEVLVVGWKPGAGRRAGTIGSLLVAVFDEGDRLAFAGHVGTGFSDAGLRALHGRLGPLARTTPPVPDVPREHARLAHWVEPVLVGEVAYRNWTPDGRLRHPVWRGLRTDQPARAASRGPAPIPPPPPGVVEGALQTPDGRWRVEAVRRGRDRFYRLIHAGNIVDGLAIATVERLLRQAGIDLADLIEPAEPPARRHGAA